MQTRVEQKPSTTKRMLIMIGLVLVLIAIIAGVKVLSIMRLMASFKPPPPAVVTPPRPATRNGSRSCAVLAHCAPCAGRIWHSMLPGS